MESKRIEIEIDRNVKRTHNAQIPRDREAEWMSRMSKMSIKWRQSSRIWKGPCGDNGNPRNDNCSNWECLEAAMKRIVNRISIIGHKYCSRNPDAPMLLKDWASCDSERQDLCPSVAVDSFLKDFIKTFQLNVVL